MESNQSSALFSLTIDPVTKVNLTATAKWARFLAIVGMILLALMLIASFIGATVFTTMMGSYAGSADLSANQSVMTSMRAGMIVMAIITIAIFLFPLLFLLRFANSMLGAIAANDQQRLNTSFQHLKSFFRFIGILIIIMLVFYAVIIAVTIIGAAAFSSRM